MFFFHCLWLGLDINCGFETHTWKYGWHDLFLKVSQWKENSIKIFVQHPCYQRWKEMSRSSIVTGSFSLRNDISPFHQPGECILPTLLILSQVCFPLGFISCRQEYLKKTHNFHYKCMFLNVSWIWNWNDEFWTLVIMFELYYQS